MTIPVREFPSRQAAMQAAADLLADAIERGLETRGQAALALSGGSTPEPAYALLAVRDLDWKRVAFGLVDERWVPPSDAGSNEAMLRRALAPALTQRARLVPLWSDAPSLEAGAQRADQAYAALAFDAALLGMGADGHTASWFPGSKGLEQALDENSARVVVAVEAPQAAGAAQRLTLTGAALARAGRLVLLITGADKRAVWERAFTQPARLAPVRALAEIGQARLDVLWAP
jgi:6-phosphogluconolactonase